MRYQKIVLWDFGDRALPKRRSGLALMVLFWLAAGLCWFQAVADYSRFQASIEMREEAYRLFEVGRPVRAMVMLEEAYRLTPNQLDICLEAAAFEEFAGCPGKALTWLERAALICPHKPALLSLVHRRRACYFLRCGEFRLALRDFRLALDWEPRRSELVRLLELAQRLYLLSPDSFEEQLMQRPRCWR